MKLVSYLRVSTDKQADQGLGLDVQETAARTWAKTNGHKLATVVADEGISGASDLEARPGLLEVMDLVRSGQVGGVLVYRLDRLARDLIVQETLLGEFRRLGGQVFSTSEAEANYVTDDPSDPSRKLIRQVLGAVAEYERAMTALRLQSGRAAKATAGGYAYGAPSLGYVAEDGELALCSDEADTLARIYELHDQGKSLREIAVALEAEQRPTKRGGTRWHPNTLSRILARPRPEKATT